MVQRIRSRFSVRVLAAALAAPRMPGLRSVHESLTMPLRRTELAPGRELVQASREASVSRLTGTLGWRVWLVSGYDEARAVLADTRNFSNDIRPLVGKDDIHGPDAIGGLGFTDPPDHTRLRRLLTPEFTRRRLQRLQPRITEIVNERLDALAATAEPVDVVRTFASPVPLQVICELLGLSSADRAAFTELAAARFDASGGLSGLFGSASSTRAMLIDVAARQRRSPSDGLLGSLIEEHGDELDDVELGGLADGLFLGGYETSASMLALGTLLLLQHPDTWDRLRAEPDCVDEVVEELLRVLSVVQVAFPRFARNDCDLGGQHIRAGDAVVCSLVSANRDDSVLDHAERFDPGRSPVSHVTFGYGAHRCLGAELARIELRTAFVELVRRFPTMRLAVPPEDLRFRKLSIVYGVESLPVHIQAPLTTADDGPVETGEYVAC